MTAPGLLRADTSMLLVVDVQARLVPAIHDGAAVVERIVWLVRLAQALGVPVAATEQYPQGLGPTVPALAALLPRGSIGEKVHFSCAAAGCLPALPGAGRPQVVLAGTEAHVCVLQTAFGLAAEGREVFVVADAVALARPRQPHARPRAHGSPGHSRRLARDGRVRVARARRHRALPRDLPRVPSLRRGQS